ncbi:hypothetical protein WJX84_009994 [Apatococcus fuscideae]|uniref:DAGKc domain-containing protein n=1 Tax=Apatococcus fuscideae TaxID=2026836 RepID=A0AAW1TJ33_9CHLO
MKSPRSKERFRTIFLVLNGKKIGDEALREAITKIRAEGHRVEVRVTYEAEDSERYIAEALNKRGVDTIVAAGGDGMVNQVAAALLAHRAPVTTELGIIPMGTANDFATGLGIPTDPWEALQLTLSSPAQPIDVGMVNDEVFLNVATGGFGTEMTTKTDEGMKNTFGGLAYAITGITNIGSISSKTASMKAKVMSTMQKEERAYSVWDEIQLQDDCNLGWNQEEWSKVRGTLARLQISDKRQQRIEGGLEDGQECWLSATAGKLVVAGSYVPKHCWMMALLDVSYIMNIPLEEIPDVLARMGQTLDSGEMLDCFGSMRVKSLVVDCPDGLQVNRDGEPMRAKRLDFRVLPHRLKVHMAHDELLVQPSRVLKHASNAVHKKVEAANQAERREQRQSSGASLSAEDCGHMSDVWGCSLSHHTYDPRGQEAPCCQWKSVGQLEVSGATTSCISDYDPLGRVVLCCPPEAYDELKNVEVPA